MALHIIKSHNKTLLMYHIVCTIRYLKSLFDDELSTSLKEICKEISQSHEIYFIQIGTDKDHVHFLIQFIPLLSISKIVQIIKGNISIQSFLKFPELKKELCGRAFWTGGYYANTVSQYGGETTINKYIENQGKQIKDYKSSYKQIYKNDSLNLFEKLGA